MAITQPLTAVKRGNARSDKSMNWSDRGCRTQNQHEAVIAYHRRHPAAWMCGDPFKQEHPGQQFKCAFHHTFYDLHGRICTIIVSPGGRITSEHMLEATDNSAADALAVAKLHGLFRGGE